MKNREEIESDVAEDRQIEQGRETQWIGQEQRIEVEEDEQQENAAMRGWTNKS